MVGFKASTHTHNSTRLEYVLQGTYITIPTDDEDDTDKRGSNSERTTNGARCEGMLFMDGTGGSMANVDGSSGLYQLWMPFLSTTSGRFMKRPAS